MIRDCISAVDDIDDTISKMHQLKAIGVLMALYDFGTGYSSLSHLHISSIKLDRRFITGIAEHEENHAIVDATIAMAGHLGIECVPEGVELEGDVAFFRSRPVHTMQGH
jgi:EAL domain-containing protein (putative c-di-GMP-specific phosphodiesterase class I)